MSSPFQVVPLVCSPSYPNSIAWSEENLIAVATGPIVTILNPEKPYNPRGVLTIKPEKPFPIGAIDREDLLSQCMLPISLSRDFDPIVRSIAWSPVGFSPNSGCLLAVCTTDGRVKIYRQPYCEFQDEWIEVMDVSDMLVACYAKANFGENAAPSTQSSDSGTQSWVENMPADHMISLRKDHKWKRDGGVLETGEDILALHEKKNVANADLAHTKDVISASIEVAVFPLSIIQQGSLVEVLKVEGGQRVWVAGRVECLDGSKALVLYSEADIDGKEEWIEMDQRKNRTKLDIGAAIADGNDRCPKLRLAMDSSNLPEAILSADCQGAGEILKVGRAVEAWAANRWLEGHLVGLSKEGLLFKPHGGDDSVILDPSHVRLAPSWVRKSRQWQIGVVKLQKKELLKVHESKLGNVNASNLLQIIPAPKVRKKRTECMQENWTLQLISANLYASRNASLASLAVAWSPTLHFSASSLSSSCNNYSLLAVGAKSGKVSIWRIIGPQYYSVQHGSVPSHMMLVDLFQVHNAWVTTLSWGVSKSDASHLKLLLATGCSDGSVKIWLACAKDLEESTEANSAPFSLLKEVSAVSFVPVSLVSLTVSVEFPRKILLAIGRGSGSFEVWTSTTEMMNIEKIGSCDTNDHVVTGLAWAFDGRCLFTCSQDSTVRGYMLHKGLLVEAPIPPNNLCSRSFSDIPSSFDLCFGLVVSPGNLMVAVVRNFDRHTLDPMYQARIQRAAVEFFWIGGQQLNISSNLKLEMDVRALPGSSEEELVSWHSNMLWSLKQYECQDKHLVVWDMMTASLAFKQHATMFLEHVLSQWLPKVFKHLLNVSSEAGLPDLCRSLSNVSSRQLHLLNIFCRRVILYGYPLDKLNTKQMNSVPSSGENKELAWLKLLQSSEKELRERLVGFSLAAVSCSICPSLPSSQDIGLWSPDGVAQMMQWVNLGRDQVRDQLQFLASEVCKLRIRIEGVPGNKSEECSYCLAPVPFVSPEVAFCHGAKCNGGTSQGHKMPRCAVSMQVCRATPTWFCTCCHRWISKLAPYQLHTMASFPQDFLLLVRSFNGNLFLEPLCPFCGILLQRKQPGFLLSVSPV